MNDFFGGEDSNNELNPPEVEAQEENIADEVTESDPQDQELEEDINASSEDTEYEEETQEEGEEVQSKLEQKDAEIVKIREDAQNWVRAIQSSSDKQRESDQRQIIEMQNQLRSIIDAQKSTNEVDPYVDEYGDEIPLTASAVKKLYAQEEAKRQSLLEKQQREQEASRHRQKEEAERYLLSQPDYKEVLAFYEGNLKDDPFIAKLSYQDQYSYVKAKKIEHDSRGTFKKQKQKQKKKITPTGNPNRNFSNRSSGGAANNLMQALETKRKEMGRPKGFFN